jgi:hypothetical protein
VDAGEHQLKDLDRPVRLFQLAAAGLDPGSSRVGWMAGGSAAGGVHGFAAVRTSFVGRAGPVRELTVLLGQHQLVTVTGPGGSGKTRLAGVVARQVAGRFADGVWLVELAPVSDPGQVAAVVAAALGVREQPGVPAAATLAWVLARQQLLVMLDNCEHVLGAAAGLCAELVAACGDLRVLATSREGLRVAGEARYRLAPLAVPDPDDPADAAGAEAVVLFADRARQADAHFVLDGRTGPQVARLVARLLSEVAGRAEPGSDGWCAAQFWLGWAATMSADLPRAVGHFTAARDAMQDRGPSRLLADVLEGRSVALLNTGQLAEGTEDGRPALAMARDLGDPAAEVLALVALGIAAMYSGDNDGAIELIRRQQQIPAGNPAVYRAGSTVLVSALIETGDPTAAESACAAALAQCRDAGNMTTLASLLNLTADLDVRTGRLQDAAAHLREGLQVVVRARRLRRDDQLPGVLRAAVHRDRALRRGGHGLGRPGRPHPAARVHWRVARRGAQRGGSAEQDPAGAGTGPVPGG